MAKGALKPSNKKGPPTPVKTISAPVPRVHPMTFMQAFLIAGAASGLIGFLFIGGMIYLTTPPPQKRVVFTPQEKPDTLKLDTTSAFRSFRSMGTGPGSTWLGSFFSSAIGQNPKDVAMKSDSPTDNTSDKAERLLPPPKFATATKEIEGGNPIGH